MELFGFSIDAPAVSLLVMGVGLIYLMWSVAQKPQSFWAQAFVDDNAKPSWMRVAMIVALLATTWHLIYVTMNVIKDGKDLEQLLPFYGVYLLVWSGAKVAEKAIDAILAKFGVIRPQP